MTDALLALVPFCYHTKPLYAIQGCLFHLASCIASRKFPEITLENKLKSRMTFCSVEGNGY